MADKVNIEGGPADGMQVAPGGRFEWLDVVVVKRAERTPTAGLYELRDGTYQYVGGHVTECRCGGTYARAEGDADRGSCPLCGAPAAGSGAR